MKKKILLIEDSPIQLKSIEITLSKLGHEIITSPNAIEGIEKAYQFVPDLIISDIVMPEINGYQLCRLLKNDNQMQKVPIILLTQLNEKLDSFWALKAGADCFITKSDKQEEFLEKVQNFLDKSIPMSEEERQSIINEKKSENINLQTRINNLLDQSLIESTIINEFRNLSEFIYSTKILSKELFSLAFSLIDFNVAALFFNERDDKKKKNLQLSIQNCTLDDKILIDIKNDFFSEVFSDKTQEDDSYNDVEIIEMSTVEENKINNFSELQSKIILPISYANKVIGGIAFYNAKPHRFNHNKIIEIILKELKILMRIKWLYSETKYLAIIDGLTGLYNRRFFQQTIEREFARSKRHKTNLSIALFDVDHFKLVNDNYGHQFGDKALAEISKIIKASTRKTDYVTRYGGEEIILVLPDTTMDQALIPIERIRKKIENKNFEYKGQFVKITVSCGLSEVSTDVHSQEELVLRADKSLYESKRTGRNKTTCFNSCLNA
ncbi:MAG TPA: diguanylate cyclase [Candidatus Gastranaerophilales bacterium]|nr:diguanylate cyclase [Candidatus Gastranaerophilales bacterium]